MQSSQRCLQFSLSSIKQFSCGGGGSGVEVDGGPEI